MFAWIKKEWFLTGMLVAVILGALFSEFGKRGGILHLELITQWGIALIFFLHGVSLSPQAIKKGIKNMPLHIATQCGTWVLYPLLWVVFGGIMLNSFPQPLAFGFCYLFVLPSTISSSVALTAIGGGNVPGAVFNASLSSLLGVFLTPFLIQFFLSVSGVRIEILPTIISIIQLLIVPMVLGQILRSRLVDFVKQHKNITSKVDKVVILLIVFSAFADSVAHGIWRHFNLSTLIFSFILCCAILFFITWFLTKVAHLLGFNLPDEIAMVFCGTKKTLAAGIPMAQVIFDGNPHLGMILVPIMLYHPTQIFYCTILANRYAKKVKL